MGRARNGVCFSRGFASAPELVAAPQLGVGERQPSMGSVRGLHSEVRLSQRDLIPLFGLVENLRTSDIPIQMQGQKRLPKST